MSEKKDSGIESVAVENTSFDIPADRETSLATSFEDSHIVAELAEAAEQPQSLIAETAEAVHELVSAPSTEPSNQSDNDLVVFNGEQTLETFAVGKAELAERLFSLVLSELKFDVLVEDILKAIMHSIDAQAGSILEFDPEANDFFFRATFGGGDADKLKAFRIPANSGIVGYVAESRQSIVIQDLDDSEMQLKSISMSVGFETKSCMAVPIIIANQLYGVLEVFNKVGVDYFDPRDRQLLEEGVKMAAKVLEVRFFAAEFFKGKVA